MCDHDVSELLSAYLDGETTVQESEQVQAHLLSCPDCRAELDHLTNTQSLTAEAPRMTAPPELLETLERQLASARGKRRPSGNRWFLRSGLATAAAVALWVGIRGAAPEPISLEPLLAAHERCAADSTPWERLRSVAAYSAAVR